MYKDVFSDNDNIKKGMEQYRSSFFYTIEAKLVLI